MSASRAAVARLIRDLPARLKASLLNDPQVLTIIHALYLANLLEPEEARSAMTAVSRALGELSADEHWHETPFEHPFASEDHRLEAMWTAAPCVGSSQSSVILERWTNYDVLHVMRRNAATGRLEDLPIEEVARFEIAGSEYHMSSNPGSYTGFRLRDRLPVDVTAVEMQVSEGGREEECVRVNLSRTPLVVEAAPNLRSEHSTPRTVLEGLIETYLVVCTRHEGAFMSPDLTNKLSEIVSSVGASFVELGMLESSSQEKLVSDFTGALDQREDAREDWKLFVATATAATPREELSHVVVGQDLGKLDGHRAILRAIDVHKLGTSLSLIVFANSTAVSGPLRTWGEVPWRMHDDNGNVYLSSWDRSLLSGEAVVTLFPALAADARWVTVSRSGRDVTSFALEL